MSAVSIPFSDFRPIDTPAHQRHQNSNDCQRIPRPRQRGRWRNGVGFHARAPSLIACPYENERQLKQRNRDRQPNKPSERLHINIITRPIAIPLKTENLVGHYHFDLTNGLTRMQSSIGVAGMSLTDSVGHSRDLTLAVPMMLRRRRSGDGRARLWRLGESASTAEVVSKLGHGPLGRYDRNAEASTLVSSHADSLGDMAIRPSKNRRGATSQSMRPQSVIVIDEIVADGSIQAKPCRPWP